jgi:Fic-DOC domain mobile mystery protein B
MRFEFPEGATPLEDCSDLLLSWVNERHDLNRVEAENISSAQRKYLRPSSKEIASWFRPAELQAIHHTMFGNVWGWAGKLRKSITSIGIVPQLIPMRIAELCMEVGSWSTEAIELTFLEKSARIHHCLVQIHPFENGNGRFSRLVADRCLLCWKCQHPLWPDSLNFDGTARKQYIQALKDADRGDYEPLVSIMKEFGASDPSFNMLFQEGSYKPYLEGSKGIAKIRALLRRGADPNGGTENRHRSLQLLIRAQLESHTKFEILKLLIEKGAAIDTADKSGLTPFQVAVTIENREIALFLRSKGARALAPPGIGYTKYYNLFRQLPPN